MSTCWGETCVIRTRTWSFVGLGIGCEVRGRVVSDLEEGMKEGICRASIVLFVSGYII